MTYFPDACVCKHCGKPIEVGSISAINEMTFDVRHRPQVIATFCSKACYDAHKATRNKQ